MRPVCCRYLTYNLSVAKQESGFMATATLKDRSAESTRINLSTSPEAKALT